MTAAKKKTNGTGVMEGQRNRRRTAARTVAAAAMG